MTVASERRDLDEAPLTRRTPRRSAGDRKEQIREAALTLFSERGYHGTAMEDISRLVGMRASSLYNHVSSKNELLLDIMATTMLDLITGFVDATSTGSPALRLRRAMEEHVRYHATHSRDGRICAVEFSSLDSASQVLVRKLRRDYSHRWQRLIDAGVVAGQFETPSSKLSTYALIEMGSGVYRWYRERGPISLDDIVYQHGIMALRQLGVTEPDVVD